MQQNISLKKNVSQTERKQLFGFKETSFLFKIKHFFLHSHLHTAFFFFLFCSFLYIRLEEHVRSHTLKAAQTVSTSQYKCTDSAKLQLKSVHKQSVKLLIFLFFCRFLYSVIYIQQKKSPIYYYISFFKKEPHGITPILRVQEEKNRPYKASV